MAQTEAFFSPDLPLDYARASIETSPVVRNRSKLKRHLKSIPPPHPPSPDTCVTLKHRQQVTKVRDAMKRQLDCSRALCLACADLGNACSEAQVRDVQFQNVQYQLDEDIRKKLDDSIVKALESLENKLTPFGELVKMVQNRNKLKLDYDHYLRKVSFPVCRFVSRLVVTVLQRLTEEGRVCRV